MSDTIDTATHTLHFERTLDCTMEDAFDAWTVPEEISAWWDPTGAPLVSCAIDLRPSGSFRFVTAGHAPPFEGTYDVVRRPTRLEFHAMGSKGTVRFEAQGKSTRMNVTIACVNAEQLAAFVKLGVQAGTKITLDNLVRHVTRAKRHAATNEQLSRA